MNKIQIMITALTAVKSEVGVDGEFPQVIFTLRLRRHRLFYVVNLTIPCLLLSVIAMATFILQPCNGDRLGIGLSVLCMLLFSSSLVFVVRSANLPKGLYILLALISSSFFLI